MSAALDTLDTAHVNPNSSDKAAVVSVTIYQSKRVTALLINVSQSREAHRSVFQLVLRK